MAAGGHGGTGVPVNPPLPPTRAARAPKRRRVSGAAPKITPGSAADRLLRNRLMRVCCSEPWENVCRHAILTGKIRYVRNQERELAKEGLYPPGGKASSMRQCRACCRLVPPQCVGSSGHCDECRYERMSHVRLERLQGSPGSVLDISRLANSRRRAEAVYEGR